MKLATPTAVLVSMAVLPVLARPGLMESRTQRDTTTAPARDPMYQFSNDTSFHFEILRTMSFSTYEGADVGEVLVAANKIKPGDFESYYSAFNNLATRVHNQAKTIDSRRHRISARNAFFKAASYYRSADFFLHGNWSDPRIDSLWAKQIDSFNSAMGLLPVPGERITLKSSDGQFKIPAIFFGTGRPGPRPTIILGNGYDGSQEELFHVVGEAILQRGMNVITYEGPGQPTVRRQQSVGFIPQWERVVTPVVDYALTRPEVDPKSIGLWGYSFGGILAPRAAAFEHRLAAVFAIDGIYDFGQSILDKFPHEMQEMFTSGNTSGFNFYCNQAATDPASPTAVRWSIQQGMWSFRAKTPFEWMKMAQEYTLEGHIKGIQAPVFVGNAQNDMFFPGQAELLSKKLGSKATFHTFQGIDGAGEHCSMGASILVNQVTLDWFEDVLEKQKR